MSRSVETVGENVVCFDATGCEDNNDLDGIISWVMSALQKRYPSLVNVQNKWVEYPYNENRIILENDHVQISVSEYCGCGAFSVFVQPELDEYWPYNTNLAEAWLTQCWGGVRKTVLANVAGLRRIATFSNGEAVYERIDYDYAKYR